MRETYNFIFNIWWMMCDAWHVMIHAWFFARYCLYESNGDQQKLNREFKGFLWLYRIKPKCQSYVRYNLQGLIYTFMEFKYDSSKPPNDWAFQKITIQCFCLKFSNSNLKSIHIWNLHKIYVFNNISYISMTFIKVERRQDQIQYYNFD